MYVCMCTDFGGGLGLAHEIKLVAESVFYLTKHL